MKDAFDEIMATAIKRQHQPQRIIGDLLNAEINEKQARSIKYQLTIAKLPLAKDLDDFEFEGMPINETLVNDLAGGGFVAQQRNVVLVGGTVCGRLRQAHLYLLGKTSPPTSGCFLNCSGDRLDDVSRSLTATHVARSRCLNRIKPVARTRPLSWCRPVTLKP